MNVARGQTIADRAIAYIRELGTGVNTGAIANALGKSIESIRSSLVRYTERHPGELTYENGFWYVTPATPTDHVAEADDIEDELSDQFVDELDEALEAMDEVMDAIVVIRRVREALPELLRKARLGDSILATLDRHITG